VARQVARQVATFPDVVHVHSERGAANPPVPFGDELNSASSARPSRVTRLIHRDSDSPTDV
jgi:hypothetical protein